MARLKNWRIPPDAVLWLTKDRHPDLWTRVGNGPPVGAVVRNAGFDFGRKCFVLTVEHESFEDVPVGGEIPFAAPMEFFCRVAVPVVAPKSYLTDDGLTPNMPDCPTVVGG